MFLKKKPDSFAAIDLGSNSFHMTIAQIKNGQVHIIDTLKEMVRLASGITKDRNIDKQTASRALECLQRFGQRIQDLSPQNVRVIGTNAFRCASHASDFLSAAEQVLGHPIRIIAGMEEARLIYRGVHQYLPLPGQQKLVIDIGGGSTELVIGKDTTPLLLESLYMGCVGFSLKYFPDNKISNKSFAAAVLAAKQELEPISRHYLDLGWEVAIGSSGTIRSIADNCLALKLDEHGINLQALHKLRDRLLDAGHIDTAKLPSLTEERRPVFTGGLAILTAIFESLNIDHMLPSQYALREGILYELIGRSNLQEDIRSQTIAALCQRYQVDRAHADRVTQTALRLLHCIDSAWELDDSANEELINWAAQLHEIGLTISHSRYHRHGGYLIENSDLAGFTREEQIELAALVRLHRRKLRIEYYQKVGSAHVNRLLRLASLLRIAVVLHRGRQDQPLPELQVQAHDSVLNILFPPYWLEEHPLTAGDLEQEAEYLRVTGIELTVK